MKMGYIAKHTIMVGKVKSKIVLIAIIMLFLATIYVGLYRKNRGPITQKAIPNKHLEETIKIQKEDKKEIQVKAEKIVPSSWCMLIDKPGYYELTANIVNCTKECGIYINASNVVLDGKGHIINGVWSDDSMNGIYRSRDKCNNKKHKNTAMVLRWNISSVFKQQQNI